MKNVNATVKDGKLIIEVDLEKEFGRSSSGKTIIIASSEGNQAVPGMPKVRFGLNVYKYPDGGSGYRHLYVDE